MSHLSGKRSVIFRTWPSVLIVTTVLFPATPSNMAAQDQHVSLNAIKVGFLFNVAKFVTWPETKLPTASSPIRFGIMGSQQIKKGLTIIASTKKIDQHPLEVMQEIKPAQAHVLFVSQRAQVDLKTLSQALRAQGVLVVSDQADALTKDAHIAMFFARGKLHFRASQKAAKRDQLQLKSRLLSLADDVIR